MGRLANVLMAVAALAAAAVAFTGCGGDDQPTAPTVGSCCLAAGACSVTTQANCAGNWTEAGSCDPNPCAQPTGACCALDGTCTVTLQTACLETWTMFGSCDPNPCVQPPPPTGSCCHPSGVCAVTLHADCPGPGTWTLAGVCDPNPCPQPPPPGMIWIPAGNVRLGQVGVPGAEPVNDVYVEGFYIDRYEVTNARYKAFIDAGGYATEAYWHPVGWAWRVANNITTPDYWNSPFNHGGGIAGNEQFPVTYVSWWEADAYCRWEGSRLPTEAEWEKAAKGGCEAHGEPGQCDATDTPTYPWGEGITGPQANGDGSGDPYEDQGATWTTPVGYYDGSNHAGYQTIDSPSPYGLYDVAGNVWEWCSTKMEVYPYDANDGRENPPVSDSECCRVKRGGSWSPFDGLFDCRLRCAYRLSQGAGGRSSFCGFRCARSS